MVCRCGYQNEPDDFYCAQCGRKLSKGNGKGWIIAIVIVLLLAAGAVAAWFLFSGNKPEEEPDGGTTEAVDDTDTGNEDTDGQETIGDGETKETLPNGWDEAGTHYYQDGELLKGQQTIDGKCYYFSEDTGEMLTGWQNIGDSWYYYTAEGPAPGAGWYEDDIGWFYLEENGRLCTASSLIPGEATFTLNEEGYLVSTVYATVSCTTETAIVDGTEQEVLKLPGHVTGCTKLGFTMHEGVKIETMGAAPWTVWVRYDDVWTKLTQNTDFAVDEGEVYVLTFTTPVDMDAILISCGPNSKVGFMFTNLVCVK